jgi:hypothetical protein
VEPTYAQLIALFAAWVRDIDSEPFAYEGEWTSLDSPRYQGITSWVNHKCGQACPGGH